MIARPVGSQRGALLAAFLVLLVCYLLTLQTIPNGAEHYYMIDVGETQIVLNLWGTLHATGYPFYVMVSSLLVAMLRAVGISPATAPAVVSLLYGLAALFILYLLAAHLTGRRWLSAAVITLFGLTRTVWIHAAIAEIYSFGLLFLALLLLIALWRYPIRGRIYWLAIIGGFGVFHHRALIMAVPALVCAVWPELTASPRRLPRIVLFSLLLGLLGFLPYLYLPLRAASGAAWVYGEPGTWQGFWDQFLGREAARFIGPPATPEALFANFNAVIQVLITDLTVPGLTLGVIGLLLALRRPDRRRPALTMLLLALVSFAFHVLLYTDILSALILSITLPLAFGWLLLALELTALGAQSIWKRTLRSGGTVLGLALAVLLIADNLPFIRSLTTDPTGMETITLARAAPTGSALMLDWGPRHFAVGFARDVLGQLPGVDLLSHKADFRRVINIQPLVTLDFTFYNRPVSWWQQQLGRPVYLRALAPRLVQISLVPELRPDQMGQGVVVHDWTLDCEPDALALRVSWLALSQPVQDLSVFVHLLDAGGTMLAQSDQAAPVYGWRPLTTWLAGEVVRDLYPLPRPPDAARIAFGLYRQLESGAFENVLADEIPVECP